MKSTLFNSSYTKEVIELFTKVFSESENELEGQIIGKLVSDLIATTEPEDLVGFATTSNERIVGCIFFSRFIVPGDELAFILSPVAIATSEQGTGIGQKLINYGLNHLKSLKVNLAFTYGDPSFYSKVGFSQISERVLKAPYKLSQPEGWLAQSLDGNPIKAIRGSSSCVGALSDQKYW
ncbi:MAG: N-acetyltransferase [Halioglobus sp.]